MSGAFTAIEEMVYNSWLTMAGDQSFIAFLIFGVFAAFVMLQNTRLDVKVLVLVPAFILASAFAPRLAIVIGGLVMGGILFFALMKLSRQ